MYAIMKGMRIPNPNVVSIGSHDWYAEYARYIVDEQNNYGNEYVVDHSWLAGYLSAEHATAWALATLTLTVTTPGPVAEAGSNVDNYPPTIPVKFDASGSYHRDPTKSIVLYEWDFDSDGTWDYSGTDLKVEHAYPAYYNPDGSIDWDKTAKDYTATLRVTDNSDPVLQDTDTCIIHITAPPWKPVADPDGPYEVSVGVSIQLDGSKSYDPESKMYPPGHPWYETIAKYEWDLDNDGKFDDSTDTKPSYEWDAAGIYSVGLKVTDSQASGPGGTIGPLDVDIKYTIVLVSKEARRFNPLIDGFYFENYARQTDCISMYTVQQIYDKIKSMFPADIPAYLVLTAAEMLYAWKAHEAHCFGMAKTAIYYYDHQSEIPTRYSQVYDILWDDKDDVPAARTMIENYQHEQVFTDINAIFNILLYFELNSVGSPLYPKAGLEVEAPAIMTMSQQLKPALLDLWGTETGDWKPVGHTVVAYECKQVDNGYDISTYDSNMPGQNHEFKLRRDLSGRLSIDDDGDPWFVWNDLVCVNAPLVGWTWDYIKDNAAHLIDWIKDNLKDLWDELKALRNQVPDLWNQFTDWASDNSKDIWDRLMRVKLFSHAQLNVYNSKGLHVGLTPDGNLDQEFNAMFLASDTMQLCVLPNPETGAFKVKLVGVSAGSYTLSLESIAQGVVVKEELITKEISEGDVHEYNLWLTPTGDFILDNTSPTTSLSIGDPKYTSGTTYVTPDTPFTLAAMDTGSGVKSTAYRINSTSYDSGWLTYTKPFNLTSLHDGNYTIGFNSTDNVGNVETTHEVSVTLFSWNYVFKDSDGRGTVLKVSTAYKFFQFTAPTKDFGVKYDSKMVQLGKQVIIICYEDKQMRLTATATNYETCLAIAWDKQTCKTYWLIEHPPAYTLTVYCKDATGKPISGASVYLNGCCKGQTDANGKLAMTNVLAGKYTVTAKKCGYKDTSSTTTINGDASLTLTMTAQTYTLTVCCKDSKGKAVSSANVYLNSNLKGATDLNGKLTITNLSAGTYTVTVKKSGYKDTSVNVTVIGDKTITITMMK
jgi:PKD repeat protein